MDMVSESVQHLDPVIMEKRLWNLNYLFFAMIIGFIIVISIVSILFLFDLSLMNAIAMVSIFIAFYSIFLFFLVEPKLLREIQHSSIRTETYERPVFQEVIKEVEKPVIREVIKEIEKPVIKEVIKEVDKPVYRDVSKTVYVESPRKKLNIPRYDYFGSTETKTYHARKCRLRKLIKRKYLVTSNTSTYFINRNFKPCKICLPDVKVSSKKSSLVKTSSRSKAVLVKPSTFSSRAALIRKNSDLESQLAKNTGAINQMIAKIDKVNENSNKNSEKVSKQLKKVSSKVEEASKKSVKATSAQLEKVSSKVDNVSLEVKKASK